MVYSSYDLRSMLNKLSGIKINININIYFQTKGLTMVTKQSSTWVDTDGNKQGYHQ